MADMVTQKNIAALITTRLAAPFGALTAGGAGNNVAVNGATIDRFALTLPRCAAIAFLFQANLAAGNTLSIVNAAVQTSSDGVAWSNLVPLALPNAGVVATGAAGGGAVSGQVELPALLDGGQEYVRVVFTPVLSAANTDTAVVTAAVIFGGFERLPSPA